MANNVYSGVEITYGSPREFILILYSNRVKQFEGAKAGFTGMLASGTVSNYAEAYVDMMKWMFPDIEEEYKKSLEEKQEKAERMMKQFETYRFRW